MYYVVPNEILVFKIQGVIILVVEQNRNARQWMLRAFPRR